MADALSLQSFVDYFEESEQTTDEARKLSERDRDYYDGKQLTSSEEEGLNKNKQPIVIYNRIQRKIDFLSGLEKQQRKDPRAFPRNPADEAAAQAGTDALRYVCDDQDWDEVRSQAWDDLLIEGTCAVFVGIRETKQGADPSLAHIPWDRFFYDAKSSRPDFSDARYMGIVTWYDMDDAKAIWEEKEQHEILDASLSEAASETYEDKPRYKQWGESKARRIRICETYCRKGGVWHRAVYTKTGFLEEPEPSPYLDEEGEPENPIKAASLYVDRDNNRYGAVRVMISPQDEINKRRSKGLHLLNMRQARIGTGAGIEAEEAAKRLQKPDGVIVAEKGDFEILDHNDMATGNLALLQEAKNEIDLLGANAALAGKNEADQSGRAILAQQQGGMVEVARAFDRLRSLSLETYRAIWNRIRQTWTSERWVRVTDDERNIKFVGINQPITVSMLAQEVGQGDPQAIEMAARVVGPQVMQAFMAGDPSAQMTLGMFVQNNAQQVVGVRNAVNELDVDIVIDEGMDTPTVQAEQFEALVKIIPAIVNMPPHYAKLLVMASQLRDKDQILEMLDQAAQADPMQEVARQLELKGKQAENENTQADTVVKIADAQSKQAGIMTDAYRAGAAG